MTRAALPALALACALAGPADAFTVAGRVHEWGTPDPVPGAIIKMAGATTWAESDAEGRFRLEVPDGTPAVTVAAPGFRSLEVKFADTLGTTDQLRVALPRIEVRAEEVVVRGRREARQASESSISRDEIRSTPGTAGDALRAVQNLPGVTMVNDMLGQMTVRGGGPNDNLYLIDGIPWPVPFHFGGIMSTVNSSLLREVDLYAAGFDARWGGVHGAVLDAHTRPGDKDRFRGTADLNLVSSEAMLEGPLPWGDASWTIGGRRSYYDLLFGSMFKDTFTAFPRFWDLGASLDASVSPKDRIRLLALATDDLMGLNITEEMTEEEGFSGTFRLNNTYRTGGLAWTTTRIPGMTSVLTPYAYEVRYDMGMGDIINFDNRSRFLGIREEAHWEAGSLLGASHALGFGAEVRGIRDSFTFSFDDPRPGQDDYATTVEGEGTDVGAWLKDRAQFGERAAITFGGRFDRSDRVDECLLLPRTSAEWKAGPRTTLRVAWGMYSQFPNGFQLNPDYGNPDLAAEHSQHTVLGVERDFGRGLFGRVEAYHKWYSDLIVDTGADAGDRDGPPENMANDGTGIARGVELFLKQRLGERFFGWVSYSFSSSKRKDGPGEPWNRYRYDQPHSATVVASVAATTKWRLGVKARYNSGPLVTPVTGRYQDPLGEWHAVRGDPYSKRLGDYFRLDARIERTFHLFDWNLRLYFEEINVLNRKNPAGLEYNRDYSEERVVGSLPRIFYLGLEARI